MVGSGRTDQQVSHGHLGSPGVLGLSGQVGQVVLSSQSSSTVWSGTTSSSSSWRPSGLPT